MSAVGPNGNSYKGYTNGAYNAQTGNGVYNSGRNFANPTTGQTAGYTQNTQFTRGQGGDTTIDTDHHGDYNVDWQKGQPVSVTNSGG
jgi:hypothetical protein